MKHIFKLKKLNNAGMSFVELLTAMVILAIVVVPFLHSFMTSANTNAKARNAFNATNIASDAMEEFEAYTVEELLAMVDGEGNSVFSAIYNPTGNDFTLTVDGAHYEPTLQGYSVEIKLDPDAKSAYTTYNSLNVSDVLEIKADACGLYAMVPEADMQAYKYFKSKNETWAGDSNYTQVDLDYFKEYLQREITVELSSRGYIAVVIDGVNTTIRHVSVSVEIKYTLPEGRRTKSGKYVVSSSETVYRVTKDIYDNSSSKVPFESVYLLYTPRFTEPVSNPDRITIKNLSNIEGTCLIMREETDEDDEGFKGRNYSSYKAVITLEERPSWGPGCTDATGKRSALNIRTNLFDDTNLTSLKFIPEYKPTVNIFKFDSAYDLEKRIRLMGYKTSDGRSFLGTSDKARIYSIDITVKKGTDVLATISGTKTE